MNVLRSVVIVTAILFLGAGCGGASSTQEPEGSIGPPMRSALSAPSAGPTSSLAAFALSTGNPRVYFTDSNNQVSELAWKPSWSYDDPSGDAGAPPAAADTALAGFAVTGDLPRVYYVTSSPRHVHELWWDGLRWHDQDLCSLTQAPDVAAGGAVVGLKLDTNNSRVYFVSANTNHVWQLAWTGSSWSAQDVSQLAGVWTNVGRPDALAAFAVTTGSGSYARVYYVGTDQHVYEFWSNGLLTWGGNDLTRLTNTPTVQAGTGITGLVLNNTLSRVYYVSPSLHVIALQWTGQGWTSSDLTIVSHAVNTGGHSALTSLVMNGSLPRVYFTTDTAEVYELWYDGNSWYAGSLTARTSAPAPRSNSPLAGLALPSGESRVYYLGTNSDVYQLAWNGTGWGFTDVTAAVP